MSILSNIQDVQTKVLNDPEEGVRIKALAVEAIYGGMPNGVASDGWKAYMKEFEDKPNGNPQQLARLTTTAGDNDPDRVYQKAARAYLVGNGTCLPATITGLPRGIEGNLDI